MASNIKATFKGDVLTLEIPLSKGTRSASGKTMIVATTGGNKVVGQYDGHDIVLGLNAYFKA